MDSMDATDSTPLCTIADERDREEATRRRLCRERCEAMELRLVEIGFSPGTSYWSLAMLVARLCDGWRPLRRSLDRIANDRDLATASKRIESRRRIVRRAIAELERYGLLSTSKTTGATRRATRPAVDLVITLNRAVIVGEIPPPEPSELAARDADNGPDNQPDNATDNGPDNERDTARTTGGQTQKHTVLSSHNPKTLGPLSPLGADPARTVDQSFVTDRESIEPTAVSIARALRWPIGRGDTVWRIAAAFVAGWVDESDLRSVCRGAIECHAADPIGYMRNSLSERLGHGKAGTDGQKATMRAFLARVHCRGGFPTDPPPRRSATRPGTPTAVPQRPPASERPVDWNERRNSLIAACAAVAVDSGDSVQ
ncbi:MAG: hypothetical protein KDB00_10905 [Planctomycetales bacterium]|nr:hypothetical protein [Planctomycetales bacterium]